jgi:hypothetical protein
MTNEAGLQDSEYQDFLMWQAFSALSEIYDIKDYDEFVRKIEEAFNGKA